MHPLKIIIDKNEIHAIYLTRTGYPMPGETFTFDAHTYTVHTVAHTWHNHNQTVTATADRKDGH